MDPIRSKESEIPADLPEANLTSNGVDRKPTPLKQIRTFQGDVAEALQREQRSLVSIQQAEHLKNSSARSSTDKPPVNSRRTELFYLVLGSLVLFILGAVGVWYTYDEFMRRSATPITTAPANRFISADTETNLNLAVDSRETLINTLSAAVRGTAVGELRHIILPLSTSEFLNILGSQAPGSLTRAFDPLFMFGAFGESAFLIIKLISFENAFAGMLAWEKNLNQDIGPLFVTAELSRNISPESTFTDITDKNKDIRVLALDGEPILLYSFFDNNMLVITDHIETLRTLNDRLAREKLSR